MSSSITYRIGGTPAASARLVINSALNPAARFCRAIRVEARSTVELPDPTHTFMRVHITCPDSVYEELPPLPGPPPPPPYLGDPPVPAGYPAQPLIVYDAAASFSSNMRSEIGLINVPGNVAPAGPIWYTMFPFVITLISSTPINASIIVQYT